MARVLTRCFTDVFRRFMPAADATARASPAETTLAPEAARLPEVAALEDAATRSWTDAEVCKYIAEFDDEYDLHNWLAMDSLGPYFFTADAPRNDKDFVLAAIRVRGWWMIRFASDELKADHAFVRAALLPFAGCVPYYIQPEWKHSAVTCLGAAAADALFADRGFMRAAAMKDGLDLADASPELRADREIVLACVRQNGGALRYASQELSADREVVRAAVKQDAGALLFAAEEMRGDRAVVLEAAGWDAEVLMHAAASLQADRDVVLACVRQKGHMLRYAAPELQADREVVLAAVQRNGVALRYAAQALKADAEVVQVAVNQCGSAARVYAAPELR